MAAEENDVYIIGVVYRFVSVVGVVGNLITLLILKTNKSFLVINDTRLPIGNLAVVDLIFSIGTLLSGIDFNDEKITASNLACNIIPRFLAV